MGIINQKFNIVEENRQKLIKIFDGVVKDATIPEDKKVSIIIHATSLVCALVAAQPIPFADIFILTPIQLVMVTYLNKIIGNPYKSSELKEIITSLFAIVGWGVLAQQLVLGAYKTIIPFLGAITTIPLVYAATFALGNGARVMIESKLSDRKLSDTHLRYLVKSAQAEAKKTKSKMTIESLQNEIKALNIQVKAFEAYQIKLISYEKSLKDLGIYETDDVTQLDVLNLDIHKIFENKHKLIEDRLKGYKNISMDANLLRLFTLLEGQFFLEIIEPSLGDINFKLEKLNISRPNNRSAIYEVQVEAGIFKVKLEKNFKHIQYLYIDEKYYSKIAMSDYVIGFLKTENDHWLKDQEIKNMFVDTFSKAEKEICIISPWANDDVMNAMNKHIIGALEKGVSIKILYGIGEPGTNSYNVRSQKTAKVLKEKVIEYSRYGTFKIKESNTHVKLLICDESYYVQGSYNYLSFIGDYKKDKRHELAIYSENKDELIQAKQEYFSW